MLKKCVRLIITTCVFCTHIGWASNVDSSACRWNLVPALQPAWVAPPPLPPYNPPIQIIPDARPGIQAIIPGRDWNVGVDLHRGRGGIEGGVAVNRQADCSCV